MRYGIANMTAPIETEVLEFIEKRLNVELGIVNNAVRKEIHIFFKK